MENQNKDKDRFLKSSESIYNNSSLLSKIEDGLQSLIYDCNLNSDNAGHILSIIEEAANEFKDQNYIEFSQRFSSEIRICLVRYRLQILDKIKSNIQVYDEAYKEPEE